MKSNQNYQNTFKNSFFSYNNLLTGLFALAFLSVGVLGAVGFKVYQKKLEVDRMQSSPAQNTQALGAHDIAENLDLIAVNKSTQNQISPQIKSNQNLSQEAVSKPENQAPPKINVQTESITIKPEIKKQEAQDFAQSDTRPKENIPKNFKNLTPADFHSILLSHTFEDTTPGKVEFSATGNSVADERINQIAQKRGFQLWPQAVESALIDYNSNIKLHPKAKTAFNQMQEAAKKDGVILGLVSGYRSQGDQNKIFKPRFEALEMAELGGNYNPEELAAGEGDDLINRAMSMTAPPGYSRHHTGYTVDLSDLSPDNTTSVFNGSKAFKWLSENNYFNARKFGFIPSYPTGLSNVGPEPEAWEYVWVGQQNL